MVSKVQSPPPLPTRVALIAVAVAVSAPGFVAVLDADLGLGPWHVLQQGISERSGVSIGVAGWLMGIALAAAAALLKQRPGPVTVVVIVAFGAAIDRLVGVLPDPELMWVRFAYLIVGTAAMALGGALLMTARSGTSPLDALMKGVFENSPVSAPMWAIRLALEVVGLTAGIVAGGQAGVGSIVIGVLIGPAIAGWLALLGTSPTRGEHPTVVAIGADMTLSDAVFGHMDRDDPTVSG